MLPLPTPIPREGCTVYMVDGEIRPTFCGFFFFLLCGPFAAVVAMQVSGNSRLD